MKKIVNYRLGMSEILMSPNGRCIEYIGSNGTNLDSEEIVVESEKHSINSCSSNSTGSQVKCNMSIQMAVSVFYAAQLLKFHLTK